MKKVTKPIANMLEMYAYWDGERRTENNPATYARLEVYTAGMRDILNYAGYEDEIARIDAENGRLFSEDRQPVQDRLRTV